MRASLGERDSESERGGGDSENEKQKKNSKERQIMRVDEKKN